MKNLQKYEHIIFDFDGTIADTLELSYDIMLEMSEKHTFTIPKEQIENLRDFDVDAFINLLEISRIRFYRLLFKGKKILGKRIQEVEFCKGMEKILYYLNDKYMLSICTSNSEKNVHDFLIYKHIDFFDSIISGWKVSGKKQKLKKFIKKNDLDKNKILYIGDEIRDIQASQSAGIDVLAVTWGFNSKEKLEAYNPTYIVNNPEEIKDIL